MNAKVVRIAFAGQLAMPWANGGGSTRQVAIDPADGSLVKGFRWRVSRAVVGSDGPFSVMPGVDRSLWLWRGAGMRLVVDGRVVEVTRPLQRFDFGGEAVITARLIAGPCEDLNVMTARGDVCVDANVIELGVGEVCDVVVCDQRLVVVLSGEVGFVDGECGEVVAGAGDALRADGVGCFVVRAVVSPCVLLVCRFHVVA